MKIPTPPAHIVSMQRYIAGRSVEEVRRELNLERIIKLASNENPLGPPSLALKAMEQAKSELSLYPDGGLRLREKLAERLEVHRENVIVASGSEGVLSACMRAYLVPGDEVITAEGTFIGFYVLANAQNLDLKTVPLKNYTFDLEAISAQITGRTRLVYLANPNNPTGTAFSRDDFHRFLEKLPDEILVIVDEAYFDYASEWEEYPDSLDYHHDQVVTLRTFSKSYGLAGVRIGYGVAHEEIIESILKVKLPFEPTTLAEAAGLGALDDEQFLARTLEVNRLGKLELCRVLDELNLPYPRSVANFVLVDLGSAERAAQFSHDLLLQGIIARPMTAFRLPQGVRITIGTCEENEFLIKALRKIVQKTI